jgi:hypothetical protein
LKLEKMNSARKLFQKTGEESPVEKDWIRESHLPRFCLCSPQTLFKQTKSRILWIARMRKQWDVATERTLIRLFKMLHKRKKQDLNSSGKKTKTNRDI